MAVIRQGQAGIDRVMIEPRAPEGFLRHGGGGAGPDDDALVIEGPEGDAVGLLLLPLVEIILLLVVAVRDGKAPEGGP